MASDAVGADASGTGWPRPCPKCEKPTDHLVNGVCQNCYDRRSQPLSSLLAAAGIAAEGRWANGDPDEAVRVLTLARDALNDEIEKRRR